MHEIKKTYAEFRPVGLANLAHAQRVPHIEPTNKARNASSNKKEINIAMYFGSGRYLWRVSFKMQAHLVMIHAHT